VGVAAAVGLVAALAGCGDDSPAAAAQPPTLVEVATQRCRQPNRFHGIGVVAGDGLVLTAGHTVEGDLRALDVDGVPARVVTIDRRTDLALVRADVPGDTPTLAPRVPDAARMLTLDSAHDVAIDRHVTLVVEHATDRATYRRSVVIFTPGVVDGDSGAPVVDESGRLVGVVIADQHGEGVAVDAGEVKALLAAVGDDLTLPEPPGPC
jgi:S1-C subfamily serine protease